ncbi:hypothetical protein MP228_009166 [Amoeboaphelidium protococcarum]|nr:hypothetical protein MP228_009166 [Amoeboaphelidium protococcarum]
MTEMLLVRNDVDVSEHEGIRRLREKLPEYEECFIACREKTSLDDVIEEVREFQYILESRKRQLNNGARDNARDNQRRTRTNRSGQSSSVTTPTPAPRPLQLHCIIDSGASHCFVSRKVTENLGIKIESYISPVKAVSGQFVSTLGLVKLPYRIENVVLIQQFYVIDQLDAGCDVIFGFDWLSYHNPAINWKSRTILMELNGQQRKLTANAAPLSALFSHVDRVILISTAQAVTDVEYGDSSILEKASANGPQYHAAVGTCTTDSALHAKGDVLTEGIVTAGEKSLSLN